jgi:hypothetical protein
MNEETKEILLALADRLEKKAFYETSYGSTDVDEARGKAIESAYQGVAEEIRWLVNPDPMMQRCVECGTYTRGNANDIVHQWKCPKHPSFKNRK